MAQVSIFAICTVLMAINTYNVSEHAPFWYTGFGVTLTLFFMWATAYFAVRHMNYDD